MAVLYIYRLIIYYSRIGRLAWLKEFHGVFNTTPSIIKELVKAGLRLKSKTLVAIYEVLDGLER